MADAWILRGTVPSALATIHFVESLRTMRPLLRGTPPLCGALTSCIVYYDTNV